MTQIELIEGTTRDHSRSQFFTPPKLAQRLVEWSGACGLVSPRMTAWACEARPLRVLEPSAGNGAIVRPLVAAGADVTAVEIDARYQLELSTSLPNKPRSWLIWDFLGCTIGGLGTFDLVCGNFPFHADLDGTFTLHALEFAPRIVAIYPANVFYAETREKLWTQVRPTRIAHIAKRPWPGATDYVALELERNEGPWKRADRTVTLEWWFESWA